MNNKKNQYIYYFNFNYWNKAPRDGYSANLIDNKLIIFGGDR